MSATADDRGVGADGSGPMAERIVYLLVPGGGPASGHTAATRAELAGRLAGLLGYRYGGEHPPGDTGHRPYYVPTETLDLGEARRLGIENEDDLFGGVVPHPFVATKTISHPLINPGARAPEGWSHEVAGWMGESVLPGFSAFTVDDARTAARRLLADGSIRLKLARGVGGGGQATVDRLDQLDAAIETFPADELHHGIVVERNLADAKTYSVGEVRVGPWRLAYHGTQYTVRDPRGNEVYGGSDLHVARGGLVDLLAHPLEAGARRAVELAMKYDAAVSRAWPAFFASRRNYDVVAGPDQAGNPQCGVLEQSWRIGGASPAELAALAAFVANPGLKRVNACCRETYADEPLPVGATVHYRDIDPDAGLLCKYSLVTEVAG